MNGPNLALHVAESKILHKVNAMESQNIASKLHVDLLFEVFKFLNKSEWTCCFLVCRNWYVMIEELGHRKLSLTWEIFCKRANILKKSPKCLELPFLPATSELSNYSFLKYMFDKDSSLLEISHKKNQNLIQGRNVFNNKFFFEYQMKSDIVEINLDDQGRLFARDASEGFIFCNMHNSDEIYFPILKDVQTHHGKIKFEQDRFYKLEENKIVVFDCHENKIVDEYVFSNTTPIQDVTLVNTTAQHIICQMKPHHSIHVKAISKIDKEKTHELHSFGNIIIHSIARVTDSYVIIQDRAHRVLVWRELRQEGFSLCNIPKTISAICIPPELYGWGETAGIKYDHEFPKIKVFKNSVLHCYKGVLSIWDINNGSMQKQITHEIKKVIDFCTSGTQFFIYGQEKSAFYDFDL